MRSPAKVPLQNISPNRIALIKPSALGDIVHSLPVLTALRQKYPSAHITWIINKNYEALLEDHPHLDATLPFDRSAFHSGWGKAIRTYSTFIRQSRSAQFDFVIDLQGLFRSGMMGWLRGATRRVGLETARECSSWFYTDVVSADNIRTLHAVDRYWEVVKALGADDVPLEFHLPILPETDQWVQRLFAEYPMPWIGLGVGARWYTKRWLPQHFAALAKQAQESFGGTIFFVGRPDEQPLAMAVSDNLPGPVCNLIGQTTLPELVAVLNRMDVYVANDSGPLHLAAALGRPVIAPYTCTSVRLHGPYRSMGTAVESTVWCRGSYLRHCNRLECMQELTPERLWTPLEEVLQQWQQKKQFA